ncbi:MAG: hypothetical protein GX218_03410 [Clostridiaceae bacterium]|jgi:hypothetical protein|nr:hypothetical protein [Clostridiaceae bacterium]
MRKIERGEIIELLRRLNIQVILVSLNGEARGITTKILDGYVVLLEESMSFEKLLDTLKHELYHILLGHLDDDVKNIEEKEWEVSLALSGGLR